MNGSKRAVKLTADGSPTIEIPELGITYHSRHGALGESMHIFIRNGLIPALERFPAALRLLEMGFGTGLNALLTALEAAREQRRITYTALERYPLTGPETSALAYLPGAGTETLFQQLHAAPWGERVELGPYFALCKLEEDLLSWQPGLDYHLVYFDAFAPGDQPELWTEAVFSKLFRALVPGGLLLTYCSKSIVRKALQAAGFLVEKIPGPPGKREIIRAVKPAGPAG